MSTVLETKPPRRCAVYTRKSTDEGLNQEFTSLDAQLEAGLAYIASQKHEGWVWSGERYDDGDYSGGTTERPALKRLMRDIEAGKVDAIVVYKIDRFTRSLWDFVAIAEMLRTREVAFVSVTQQFNTATPMGRLILHILLSFAQFEREQSIERVRDKVAASKRKGMWMGGVPPLGYDVRERKLVVNEEEAKLVRQIFERFLDHGCAVTLVAELAAQGHTTKAWLTQGGRQRAGAPIDRQFLFKLLRNPVYVGQVAHKGITYPGQHAAIVPRLLWDKVHAVLSARKVSDRRVRATRTAPALLRGLLFAEDGSKMYPTFTRRHGKLYRYYQAKSDKQFGHGVTVHRQIPAGEIEETVMTHVQEALAAPELAVAVLQHAREGGAAVDEAQVVMALKRLDGVWDQLYPEEQNRLLHLLIVRVQITPKGVDIVWHDDGFTDVAGEFFDQPFVREQQEAKVA